MKFKKKSKNHAYACSPKVKSNKWVLFVLFRFGFVYGCIFYTTCFSCFNKCLSTLEYIKNYFSSK